MERSKEIIGGPLVINGRQLSLSKAVRAGDFVFLTGQVPMIGMEVLTTGTVEEKILKLQDRKRNLMDAALEDDAPLMEGLTNEDLRGLLQ